MRSRELIATNEPPVITKLLLDATVVEDGQGNRRLPNTAGTDESDGSEVFCKTNDRFDEFVSSEAGPWRRGR